MSYEKKIGDGILFKNERKESDTDSDYQGDIMLEDGVHWLNAYIKTGAKGKFMTLKVGKIKGERGTKPHQKPGENVPPKEYDFNDNVPF